MSDQLFAGEFSNDVGQQLAAERKHGTYLVAISVVFASPRLLEVPCTNIEDMRLVNSLCALKEYGAGTE
jgi:hypothetical protein